MTSIIKLPRRASKDTGQQPNACTSCVLVRKTRLPLRAGANGVWSGHEHLRNRLLVVDNGFLPKYSLDPLTESEQYKGGVDKRTAKQKAKSRPADKARRVATHF